MDSCGDPGTNHLNGVRNFCIRIVRLYSSKRLEPRYRCIHGKLVFLRNDSLCTPAPSPPRYAN